MQQAYQAIRIISEAQTIRVALSTDPDELMLRELCTVCVSLSSEASAGIKAVVLDFASREKSLGKDVHKDAIKEGGRPQGSPHHVPTGVEQAYSAIGGVVQPVLAVVRDTISPAACTLLAAADFTLVAEDAFICITGKGEQQQDRQLTGANAARLRYVTWSAAAGDINKEMERILNMLREKSAVALRFAKASTRLGRSEQSTHLEAVRQINTLYLDELMRTQDAVEGLQAFLEKRKPEWRNS
ncbi:MAG: hypothetical protein ACRDIV_10665 [Ktedonobacteraceae bacterium]